MKDGFAGIEFVGLAPFGNSPDIVAARRFCHGSRRAALMDKIVVLPILQVVLVVVMAALVVLGRAR